MATEVKVPIIITAEERTKDAFGNVSKHARNFRTEAEKLMKVLGVGLVAGIGLLTKVSIDSVKAFEEQENALAQLDAVLKSTGGAAGITRDELTKLADEMQRTTVYADETVIGAENILLTFTKIGKETFPEALTAVLNMSTALKQDLQSSAIQVGKALQDPILGVTALRRVGVNFNEEAQEMIRNLVESGRQMEAQKFILTELATEFGGSATAQARTFQGSLLQLRNAVDELKERLGGTIAEALLPFIARLQEFAQDEKTMEAVTELAEAIGVFLKNSLEIAVLSIQGFKIAWDAVTNGLAKVITALETVTEKVERAKAAIAGFASSVASNIGAGFRAAVGTIGIPGFAEGGIVPGPIGSPQLAVVHGGERVIPSGNLVSRGFQGGITVNITGNNISSETDIDILADRVGREIMRVLRANQNIV